MALQEKVFNKLFEAAEIAQFSLDERHVYESSLKYYRDIKNVVDTSKEEGIKEGIEQGIVKGLKQGIEKGLSEGKKEIVLFMSKSGKSTQEISDAIGISIAEVEKLLP